MRNSSIPGKLFRSLCVVLSLAATSTALSAATATLSNNVAPWLSRAKRVGAANNAQEVKLTVYLSFRNQRDLSTLIDAQNTPGSPQYGKFLTPDQFRTRFAPNPSDVQNVEDALTALGFTVVSKPASGLFVVVSGTVEQVKSAFGVSQNLYSYKGHTLRANAEPPTLPAAIAPLVTYIAGLDETHRLVKPFHHVVSSQAKSPDAPPGTPGRPLSPCSSYWADHTASLSPADPAYGGFFGYSICGYGAEQLRAAYGANLASQTGRGVRVAVTDAYASPTIQDDINAYSKNHGLPAVDYTNFTQIVPPGIYDVPQNSSVCGGAQGWYEEETLDLEMIHSMAPDAYLLYVGSQDCGESLNRAVYNVIDNRLADIITNSWGFGSDDVPLAAINADNLQFMQAAAEGISVLFSSGDSGDLAAENGIASGSWPATSPYVTAVGGTSLALNSSSGDKQEWGWGTYLSLLSGWQLSSDGTSVTYSGTATPYAFYAGSGGGLSLTQLQPAYQSSVVPLSLATTTTLSNGVVIPIGPARRVTPDIAMVGDPYTGVLTGETYTINTKTPAVNFGCTILSATTEYCERSIGGTSAASPLFAGVLALVNQQRFANYNGPIGFANPSLYRLNTGGIGSSAPIYDIVPPQPYPTAVLSHGLGSANFIVATINSVPDSNFNVIAGVDTSLTTTPGYDNVTGLGVPNIPSFVQALGGGQ